MGDVMSKCASLRCSAFIGFTLLAATVMQAPPQELLAVERLAVDQFEQGGLPARFHGERRMIIHRFSLLEP